MIPPARQTEYDVITFSDMCVDLILSGADVTPQFGQVEKLVEDYTLELGGSCNIFACQCARLGLRTAVLGRVGDDSFGQLILRRLSELGVDTRHVMVDPQLKTGIGVALCPPGNRAILTYMGTINAVYPQDISDALLSSTRHVHHGSFFLHTNLLPAIPAVFQRAHALGASTSLDTNWDPQETWSGGLGQILPHTDLFMPNDQEALRIFQQLSGHTAPGALARGALARGAPAQEVPVPGAPAQDAPVPAAPAPDMGLGSFLPAARYFLGLGVQSVTVKAGSQGAYLFSQEHSLHGAVQPVSGGDSIGAGDSFDAGFLAGWLRGLAPQECLAIGLACGRSVAAQVGGLAGQLSWEEALRAV